MKRSAACFFFCAAVLFLLEPHSGYARSDPSPGQDKSNQEQVIKELLSEVRQLRMALQRLSVNTYRAQVTLERLRSQQDQVTRLSLELNGVRRELGEIKFMQVGRKEDLEELEKQKEAGVMPEERVRAMKTDIENLKRRELFLIERETQLSIELNTERAKLTDLNDRLDALEREVLMTNTDEGSKRDTKKQ